MGGGWRWRARGRVVGLGGEAGDQRVLVGGAGPGQPTVLTGEGAITRLANVVPGEAAEMVWLLIAMGNSWQGPGWTSASGWAAGAASAAAIDGVAAAASGLEDASRSRQATTRRASLTAGAVTACAGEITPEP